MILFLLKTWSVIRSVTGYIADLFMRYPLQFTIILLCLYIYWQKTRIDNITHEYMTYKSSISYKYDLQKVQNNILRKQAEKSLQDAQLTYDNNLKAIKNEYLKKQKLDSVTIGDLRTRLHNNLKDNSFGVPESASDTSRHSESERECYAAYSTLEAACKITTVDFNAIRSWADAVCSSVGCEESR